MNRLLSCLFACLLAAPLLAQQPAMQPPAGRPTPPAPAIAEPAQLLAALQRGGLVLYFRHGPTDWSQRDQPGAPNTPCTQQRNLSDSGRTVLTAAAAAIRSLRIPVAEVLVSQYCRCQQSAQMLFGTGTVDARVTGLAPREPFDALLAATPATGNRMLVSHQDMLRDYYGLVLTEGEAAVFRPANPPVFLGRVPLAQWAAWASTK